jgi:hydrogenase maturation protein HypF
MLRTAMARSKLSDRHSGALRSIEMRVSGLVQGVGFRPFVWRLAHELSLVGDVSNDFDGVLIHCAGPSAIVDAFIRRIEIERPEHARIDSVDVTDTGHALIATSFEIVASARRGAATALVPDMATCEACLAEIADPTQRRYGYAFTNCTYCGPRLSIIERAPYDRDSTSMRVFAMCANCRAEYTNPSDRRFHAQPIACPNCGPRLQLNRIGASIGNPPADGDPIQRTAQLLRDSQIVAIKGLGGFHLACDATNAPTVAKLRARKVRFSKPFAIMMLNLDVVRRYCNVSEAEAALLRAREAPIVLLEASDRERLPTEIAHGLTTLGVMLPYTPLHHRLLAEFNGPLVMTSGNLSDEPQCTDNNEAGQRLARIADYQLDHDRRIINRIDDSVLRIIGGRPSVLRRARGFAPASLPLPKGFAEAPPLVAMGGELKSTFCFIAGGLATVSQHLGDLENASTFDDFRTTLDLYLQLFEHNPRVCAVDLHPDYLSRKLGETLSQGGAWQLSEVQHHHAHVAACLAENNVPLDAPPSLGIVLDGLGYGTGGALWGCEFLLADYRTFRRVASLNPAAMPGGAAAIREPWRNTVAQIVGAMTWDEFKSVSANTSLYHYLAAKPVQAISSLIRSGVNSPPASSAGRLFDAVAGALGVAADRQSYEGEAAALLEALAASVGVNAKNDSNSYPVVLMTRPTEEVRLIETAPMWRALLRDLVAGTPAPVVAARFHYWLAASVSEVAIEVLGLSPDCTRTVVLSGGCFQNKLLLEEVKRRLEDNGVRVLFHAIVPANDGGLSLGQAVVAAARCLARG